MIPDPAATLTLDTSLGHRITAFEGDFIARKIARSGLYEKENLDLLLRLLDNMRHAVVLDVGANIGNHSLAFSTRARQVHAFEPLPDAFALLQRNLAQNGIDNVRAHNIALSDEAGEATLYRNGKGNVGASSFDRNSGSVTAVTVRKRTGDEVVAELGLERLDLLKVDVEAHEVFVLRGLMGSLRRFRPYIVMEWNDPLTVERLSGSEVLQYLFEDYEVHVLGNNSDRGWWQGRPFGFPRRKLIRLLGRRQAALYPFNPAKLYKNLLLVPRGKERYLPADVLLRHPAP